MKRPNHPQNAYKRVPAIVYGPDNTTMRCETEEELDVALEEGWVDHPSKVEKPEAPKTAAPRKKISLKPGANE